MRPIRSVTLVQIRHRTLLALTATLFSLSGPRWAAAAATDATEVVGVIKSFENALFIGDVKSAAALCVKDRVPPGVLDALAAEHHAQQGFCTAFKSVTGSVPTSVTSRRTAMDDNLDDSCIELQGKSALSSWGDYPLRKLDRKWFVDLSEYDYQLALTERLIYLRAVPDMYHAATNDLKSKLETRWWVAESNLESFEYQLHQKFEAVETKADDIRLARMKADLQGVWNVTITPFKSDITSRHTWPEVKGTAEVSAGGLKVSARIDGFAETAQPSSGLGTLWVGFESEGPTNKTWDLRYVRVLGQLRGTLSHKHGDEIEIYNVMGTSTK